MKKFRIPLLCLMILSGVSFCTESWGKDKSAPPDKWSRVLLNLNVILTSAHYSPKPIDDAFSKNVFKRFVEELDPEKNILRAEDIDALRKWESKIDDELRGTPPQLFLEAGKLFNARVKELTPIYKELLAKPFDFSVNETFQSDPDKNPFPRGAAQQREYWRKKLKYLALERLSEGMDVEKRRDSGAKKSMSVLEADARKKVESAIDRVFDRYRNKINDEDRFTIYVNAITQTMDPHSEFFPPVDRRAFKEELSGEFFGIGASLQYDEGYIKIASIVPGGPAAKSSQFEVGDYIVKVAQGRDSALDLTGYLVEDALKIIRGKNGTPVTITLKKKDGSLKPVPLIREKIKLDEALVRSAVVGEGANKVGYIYLPQFYANFDDPNGARSGNDVAREVKKLKEAGVSGMVIDLRNNGGGSLYDVVQMVGLFIEDGSVVQVKDREERPQVLRDKDRSVLYDGPLVVMVNEFSASASEIFAAAIQDYGRGVVIGSTSTYGKGTVQREVPIDIQSSNWGKSGEDELGSVKLTIQKFFRINGGSTQLRGVVPDVVIPDTYESLEFREKNTPSALPYDVIPASDFTPWKANFNLLSIKQSSAARIASDSIFQRIKRNTELYGQQSKAAQSLNLQKFQADRLVMRNAYKDLDSLMGKAPLLKLSYLPADEAARAEDKDKLERYNAWLKARNRDVYIDQALKVVEDIRRQQGLAKAKPKTF